jgi:hypothetical protein
MRAAGLGQPKRTAHPAVAHPVREAVGAES